jgi:hypothetical protein
VFGLLYRLLVFILLVWLAKAVFTVIVRLFGPGPDTTTIHRGRPGPSTTPPQTQQNIRPPEEDIIDVPYTEVDSREKADARKK